MSSQHDPWQQDPGTSGQEAYPQNPYAPGPPPAGWGSPGPNAYPPAWGGYVGQEHPSAQLALILGLVSLVGGLLCGLPLLLGPVAWFVGAKARAEVAESQGRLLGGGTATAGMVCGIISTCLVVIAVVAVALFLGVFAVGAGT